MSETDIPSSIASRPVVPPFLLDSSITQHIDENCICSCNYLIAYSYSVVAECAGRGCFPCTMRYGAANYCMSNHDKVSRVMISGGIFEKIHCWSTSDAYYGIEFFVDVKHAANRQIAGNESHGPPWRRQTSSDTSSSQSMRTALEWIQDCNEKHICRVPRIPVLPKRVLDVQTGRVHLYQADGQFGDYACLSHRWSEPGSMLCTTDDSIAAFEKEIPWERLSPTYQKAIDITRRLGVSYLWIDSLCIIQDSEEDWQDQSGKMASIYQNAYVTLAASCASDSTPKHVTKQMPVSVVAEDGHPYPIFARVAHQHRKKDFPLLKRGWVHQERLLSPRILHFSGQELIWECSERVDCECGCPELAEEFARPSVQISQVQEKPIRDIWYGVVKDYSTLHLTYESDGFPALSGLAQAFAELMKDEYVAGLWKSHLLQDMLWYRSGKARNSATKIWRAPSWSWASTVSDHQIRFLPCTESMAVVKEVTTQAYSTSLYGQLTSAYITLEVKAVSAKYCFTSYDTCITIADTDIIEIPTFSGYCRSGVFGDFSFLNAQEGHEDDVTLLQIGRSIWNHSEDDFGFTPMSPQQLRSYIIIVADQTNGGRWKRIGLMTVFEYEALRYEECKREDQEDVLQKRRNCIAESDISQGLFKRYEEGYRPGRFTFVKFKEVVRSESDSVDPNSTHFITQEVWEQGLEHRSERSRRIFRAFDDAPWQQFTIY